jgi:DNA repair exonuclease SbcCD ATPase subunit
MDTAEVSNAEAFAAEAGTVPVVAQSSDNAVVADAPTTKATSKFYTEDDLAKVRSQEKEKLYPQIDKLKEELDALKREREAELASRTAEEEAKAKAQQEALENDMDVRTLLKTKEQEWQEQLERERQERERAFALLEREKSFADLQSYRTQRVETEREAIIPELLDLISGNTREEIDASVEGLKERSARILESAQSAMQNARKEMTGTRVTTPPLGQMDTNMEQRNFTAEDISSMSMNDYAKYRERIMSETARGKSRGLFG